MTAINRHQPRSKPRTATRRTRTRKPHPKQHTRPHKANPETSGTRRKGDVMNARMWDNANGRRVLETPDDLTHLIDLTERGLS